MDLLLITGDFQGLLRPFSPGVSATIDTMGFFPLLDGCEVYMPSAYMVFYRARELNWYRAGYDTGLEDQFSHTPLLESLRETFSEYSRMRRPRLSSGKFSEVAMVFLGATPFYSRQVSTPTTYDFCFQA